MKYKRSIVAGFLFVYGSLTFAETGSYCLQETYSEFGDTKTCFKNISLPQEYFKQLCFPPSDEDIAVKAKYVASCPANYAGVCKGLKMQSGVPLPYISYIYKNDIPFMKNTCKTGGGIWEEGDS